MLVYDIELPLLPAIGFSLEFIVAHSIKLLKLPNAFAAPTPWKRESRKTILFTVKKIATKYDFIV